MGRHLLAGACAASLLLGTAASALAGGATERVSLGQGNVHGNSFGESFAISSSGCYVAFTSEATNLVAGDANGLADVFVRDRQTDQTRRVSLSTSGAQGSDGISYGAHLSSNGRWVAFRSQASTLVSGDTNGVEDAFVHDRQTGATRRVSLRSGGGQADGATVGVDISGNGRFVAFTSGATNLVPGDTNGLLDAFVHDRVTGVTSRVNVGPGGTQCDNGGSGGAMSADGRFVAFNSSFTDIVPGGTNGQSHGFVRERQTGTNELVTRSSADVEGNGLSFVGDLSADGRFAAFSSVATNLVPGDTNAQDDVFVHDRRTGSTRRVSVRTNGAQANARSLFEGLSANGQLVVFTSEATNLVPRDTNGAADVFVRTW